MKVLKVKLIKSWKKSWRYLSTQLAVLAALLQPLGMYFKEYENTADIGTFILLLLIPVVRILHQEVHDD